MKKPSESKPKGNCYFAAGQFALNDLTGKKFDFIGTPYVVHAEVLGKGELSGIRFGHAWVEDDEFVYDYTNNREIKFPKVLYYLIGNIKTNNPKKYRKYTFKQAREKMLETGNYGCWDIDVEFKRGGMLESADLKLLKDKYENLDFDFGTTQVDDTTTTLKAPNGKPSKLNPEQYKLVRTPEFKAWFGDWENDPANASKVVDENGEPMVVFHNTDNKFTIFDKEKLGESSMWETAYFGFYFANRKEKGSYGKKTMKCFLNIRNPYVIVTETLADFDYDYKRFDPSNFSNNDGIYIKAKRLVLGEKADKNFVAFESNQIKLADGSNTTFDSSNPDIRYDDGGQVDYSDYKTSVVALFNEDNEVLILQRGKTAPWMPNKWSLVGGVVDEGESPIESGLREIKEEIGINIDYIDFVTQKTTKDSGELFFFTGNLPKGEIIKLDYENQDYAFVNESNYEVFDFVPDVKEFLMGLFNLNTDVKYNDGGEVENKLDAIKEKFLMPISWHSYMSGYGTYKGVRLRIKDHIANWDNFYNYDLSWLENGENPYLLSIVINDEWNGVVWYKNYEQSDINVDNFIAKYQDEYPNLKAKELVFGSDSSIENIIWEIESEVEKMNQVDSYKKGGQINIDDYMLLTYHEEVGNWFVAKNEVYLWLYDDMDAGKKLQSGEYDYILFPPTPPIGMAFKKNFVPPLLQIWTKKYQAEHKGSDKLMAIVRAWYDETNHKLYILMMTTRKDLRRKGIISAMVKNLRDEFSIKQEDVIFDNPTEDGKMVLESKKYDVGGNVI